MYDSSKLRIAIKSWLESNTTRGEAYARDLLDDFNNYAQSNGLLKSSPGRVAFGRELHSLGFTTRKSLGLVWWSVSLKHPLENTRAPRLTKKQRTALEIQRAKQFVIEKRPETEAEREAARKKRLKEFQDKLKQETADKIRAAGGEPDSGPGF